MRKCILALVALLWSMSAQAHILKGVPYPEIGSLQDAHKAAFAIHQTYAVPVIPQITCDPTTGVASVGGPCTSGATCDGSADTAPAFWQFRTWALANQAGGSNQVVLSIPAGSDCVFNTNAGTVGGPLGGVPNTFIAGIKNLIVDGGTGATLSSGTSAYWLSAFGVCQRGLSSASGCSARIQTASAGATTVTLTAASLSAGYISRFSVDDWIMLGGLDTQGTWLYACGFPPNQTYFEWRKITNVNAGTGVITLDRPLTNTYLDTWPNYNSGNPPGPGTCGGEQADNGGPATIWKVGFAGAEWDVTVEYRGITFNTTAGQLYMGGKSTTFREVVFTGGTLGAIPTQNETFAAYNTTWPASAIEVDKLIGTVILDTVSMHLLQFQSNSVDLLQIRNSIFSSGLQGAGKRTEITDTSIADLWVGSYAYGNTAGPFICTRCAVSAWRNNGVTQTGDTSGYSMSGGVISFPNTDAAGSGPYQRWASTIGKTIFFGTDAPSGFYSTLGVFTVLGITQDATNTYIQTDQAGGFPDYASLGGASIQFRANGAQQFTSDDSTGDPSFTAMNIQAGATPLAPMMTYGYRAYAPSVTGNAGSMTAIGKLTTFTVDVTQAYTGSGSLALRPAQFSYPTVKQSDWSSFDWFYSINLKQAGTRVVTPSGVTCDGSPGGCSGDTGLDVPEAVWLWNNTSAWVIGTMSGGVNPQFTITIQTDQGVVP